MPGGTGCGSGRLSRGLSPGMGSEGVAPGLGGLTGRTEVGSERSLGAGERMAMVRDPMIPMSHVPMLRRV